MDTQLTHHSRFGGCGAKINPGDLSNILCGIDVPKNANVIVGLKGFDDAGVYRLNDELALVQTIDRSESRAGVGAKRIEQLIR